MHESHYYAPSLTLLEAVLYNTLTGARHRKERRYKIHRHEIHGLCTGGLGCVEINFLLTSIHIVVKNTNLFFQYKDLDVSFVSTEVKRRSEKVRKAATTSRTAQQQGEEHMETDFRFNNHYTLNTEPRSHNSVTNYHHYVLSKILDALKALFDEVKEKVDAYEAAWTEARAELIEKITAGEDLDLKLAADQFQREYARENDVLIESTRKKKEAVAKNIKKFELMAANQEGHIVLTDQEFHSLGLT